MYDFVIKNATDEDIACFPDFFLQAGLFNSLNVEPNLEEKPSGLIAKITSSEVSKLIFCMDEPVFFISFFKSGVINNINSMTIAPMAGEMEQALSSFVKSEILNKRTLFGKGGDYYYLAADSPANLKVLPELGFTIVKSHQVMSLDLNGKVDRPVRQGGAAGPAFTFKTVVTDEAIQDRVNIQNNAFNSTNRVPLDAADVRTEFKSPTYLPDLSILMYADGKPVGYGQIIRSRQLNYLVNFGIITSERGKGYAHHLLSELIARAAASGRKSIFLEVYVANQAAIQLYLAHGFKPLYTKTLWQYENGAQ